MTRKTAKKAMKRRQFVAYLFDSTPNIISGAYKELSQKNHSYNINVRNGNGVVTIKVSYKSHEVLYNGLNTRFVNNGRKTEKPSPQLLLMEALARHFYKQINIGNANIPNEYTVRISKIGEVYRVSAPMEAIAQPSPSLGGKRRKRNPSEEIANKLSNANLYALDPTTYEILKEYKQDNPEQNRIKVLKILQWLNCMWESGNRKYVIVISNN